MSSTNGNGGCGCLFLVAIIILVALAVTKPSEADHRKAFAQRTPVLRTLFGVQELVGVARLKYHDYFFFSFMTANYSNSGNGIPITYGFFGKVYYGSDK